MDERLSAPAATQPSVSLTEAEFIAYFRPETHPDGTVYVQRHWGTDGDEAAIAVAHTERRLWTYVNDGAGNASPVQGWHAVNREFYIICAVPFGEADAISVLGDIDYCTICGERFADEAHPDDPDVVTRSSGDDWVCSFCASKRHDEPPAHRTAAPP
jgi:hypothetical protein